MSPIAKDELIRNVIRMEGLIMNPDYQNQAEFCFYDIIDSLMGHEGYQPIFNPSSGPYGVDCYCTKKDSRDSIGISYKSRRNVIGIDHVKFLIPMAFGPFCNRLLIFGFGGFNADCYQIVNEYAPHKVELLNAYDIKNWISRIETETDLAYLDYENIIKLVSKTFIEKIAVDPNFLLKIEWRELEKTLAEVFEGLAFKVKLTPPSKDGGKDLILEMLKEGCSVSYIVEIKHWTSKQKVGQGSVKEFIKVVCNEKREKGIFLSTYGFTENAFEGLTELERKKVRFGDQEKITSLCKTYLRVRSGIWTPLQDLQEVLFEKTI